MTIRVAWATLVAQGRHGWHRRVNLAMLAFALPAVIRRHADAPPLRKAGSGRDRAP